MILAVFEQLLLLWGVFRQKKKRSINDCFETVNIEEKKVFCLRLNNLFQISYISFLWYEFYDFVNFICPLQYFRPFFTVLMIFTFFNIAKNAFL